MKMILKTKINLIFLFTFYSIYLFSQDPLSINLHLYHGMTGIDLNGKAPQIGLFGDKNYSVKYGNDISVGIGFNYFFDKKRKSSSSGAILWNYYSFHRKKEERLNLGFGVGSLATIIYNNESQYYQAHSILFPMKLNRHMGKLSCSLGLVPRIRLQTKMTFDITNSARSPMPVHSQYQFKAGDEYPVISRSGGTADLKHKIDLQYLVGINYHINTQLSINIEFRSLIMENKLMWIEREIGNPNSGTISFGISWKIL